MISGIQSYRMYGTLTIWLRMFQFFILVENRFRLKNFPTTCYKVKGARIWTTEEKNSYRRIHSKKTNLVLIALDKQAKCENLIEVHWVVYTENTIISVMFCKHSGKTNGCVCVCNLYSTIHHRYRAMLPPHASSCLFIHIHMSVCHKKYIFNVFYVVLYWTEHENTGIHLYDRKEEEKWM